MWIGTDIMFYLSLAPIDSLYLRRACAVQPPTLPVRATSKSRNQ